MTAPVGIVLLVALTAIVAVVVAPRPAGLALAFLAAAFPKAGVKVGDFPFPVFLFGLVLAVAVLAVGTRRTPVPRFVLVAFSAFAAWVLARAAVYLSGADVSGAAAFVAWALVPAVLLLVGLSRDQQSRALTRSIEYGFILSAVYALVQLMFGVESTAVPGLTYAYGDDLEGKFNTIYTSTGDEFSKITSTYQNGNIYGLVATVLLALSLRRIVRGEHWRSDLVVVGASLTAIGLSGSRTAIIAALLAVAAVLLGRGRSGAKVAMLLVVLAAGAGALAVQPGLAERYTVGDLLSSGGSGRAEIWADALALMRLPDVLLGTTDYRLTEGWLGLVMQLGVVGIVLFTAFVGAVCVVRPLLRLPMLVLLVGLVIDSSYMFFPTWFLFAAAAGEVGVRGAVPVRGRLRPPSHAKPLAYAAPRSSRRPRALSASPPVAVGPQP